ncbi:hypothetical protein PILCRDRAFT_747350 [Piloderma croceum F 1598]|uniref:Uncharacterized protein n=1 Tax=Piloderma croceum (strain F 1598) TaxID=765440 RepID=A0A0C3ADS6_PILCF|nr:hypothetical protein PILCRDRAFT_747350 [Piloderma croceum F 1598]
MYMRMRVCVRDDSNTNNCGEEEEENTKKFGHISKMQKAVGTTKNTHVCKRYRYSRNQLYLTRTPSLSPRCPLP